MTLRHGYFTGAGYTYDAQSEPSPERLAFLALLNRHRPPEVCGPFQLLELGCGQGFHLCLQAANYPQARFLGIDFHAEHIAHARSLAAASGLANVRFEQADFLELEQAAGGVIAWGDFDFTVAHGILSWVALEVRFSLMRLAERALRPGGLFYVSYNTLPGWLPMLPFQHCVSSLQGTLGDGQPALDGARDLFQGLRQANGQLFGSQRDLALRLDGFAKLDPTYLLHEYNNSHWQPLYANQVIEPLRELGLDYLGSATLAENFEGLLPVPAQQQIQRQSDPALRELVRDLVTNQSFRRDVYVKGLDPLWPLEASAALKQVRLCSLLDPAAPVDESSFRFPLAWGEIQGNRDWIGALLAGLGDGSRSLAELEPAIASGTSQLSLQQNLGLLLGSKALALVPGERDPAPSQRFNVHIAASVAAGANYNAVACPVSGNLYKLTGVEFLALNALNQCCSEAGLATAIDAGLRALDQTLLRDGQPVVESQRQADLERVAVDFRRRCLPLLRRLGVLGSAASPQPG
jgi:SAM-dependent methyltransferase